MKRVKYIIIFVIFILGLLLFLFLLRGPQGRGGMPMTPPVKVSYPEMDKNALYEERIFDSSYVHEINVKISNKDWEDLKANPLAKKKYAVDVVIDGIKFKNVSFKTKGNSSLKNIAEGPAEGPASNRYSFKIDFGKYEKGQNYYGLDFLNLNNIYGDASYLNDYVSYEIFRKIGIPAPLTSFTYVKINGQNLGLYSAVEEVGESFYDRNNLEGFLYKPEQTGGRDFGSSLTYINDSEDNYIDIFNNAESIISKNDKTRLINSLKQLNSYQNLEIVLDTEEIIRYFVAHNFLLSYDSYTGKSIHNYYLIENQGRLSMIPWDYNLAFGRYNMTEDISTIVNYGIDSPLHRCEDGNRPMWKWIISNEKYRTMYHKLMNEMIVSVFDSGYIYQFIDDEYNIIKPYVELDFSAFYTPQQVETAVSTLKKFIQYRAESIHLQLDGKLSTRTSEQINENRINASSIQLSDLGFIADDSLKQSNNDNSSSSDKHHSKKDNSNLESNEQKNTN